MTFSIPLSKWSPGRKSFGRNNHPNGQGRSTLRLGGTIDRMDAKEGTLQIVDYKTGGSPKTPVNIEQLFTPSETRPNYIFQTFLYAAIMSRKQP